MEDKQESMKSFFKEKGLTQEKVAELLGVSQAYVNSLFTGSKQFGKKQARRFEELFGISETWLLTGKGEMVIGTVVQNNQNGNNIHGNTVNYDAETPEKPLIQVILRSLSSSVFQASNKFATNLSENRVSDLISGTKIVIFCEF